MPQYRREKKTQNRETTKLTGARSIQQNPVDTLEGDLAPVVAAHQGVPDAQAVQVGHRRALSLRLE